MLSCEISTTEETNGFVFNRNLVMNYNYGKDCNGSNDSQIMILLAIVNKPCKM